MNGDGNQPIAVQVDMALLSETLAFTADQMRTAVRDFTDSEPELAEYAAQIQLVSDARRTLKLVEEHLRDVCARAMSVDSVYLEGIGQLERKRGSSTDRWDVNGVLDVLRARSRDERVVDEGTGEYESEADAFMRVIKECAYISYFRVGPLYDRGVSPSEYRQRSIGEPTVVIRP